MSVKLILEEGSGLKVFEFDSDIEAITIGRTADIGP